MGRRPRTVAGRSAPAATSASVAAAAISTRRARRLRRSIPREQAGFKQTDADVGSFDGGYGSAYLAKQVGQKFAREVFFLGRPYTAEQMHAMGAVNEVVDHADLERVGLQWAKEINGKSPMAQRMLKFA